MLPGIVLRAEVQPATLHQETRPPHQEASASCWSSCQSKQPCRSGDQEIGLESLSRNSLHVRCVTCVLIYCASRSKGQASISKEANDLFFDAVNICSKVWSETAQSTLCRSKKCFIYPPMLPSARPAVTRLMPSVACSISCRP